MPESRHTSRPLPWDNGTWASWAVGLVEPLVDPYVRVSTLDAMHGQAAADRLRATTLLAGTLTDLVDSLPDSDPWRRVDPERFGTWRDGTDLVPVETPDLREDIGLAALATPLPRDAAVLMSQTRHGWEAVALAGTDVADVVDAFTRAISWVTWRRRMYLGEDTYPVLAVFAWLRRAEIIAAGGELDDDATRDDMRNAAKIADDLA